MCVAPRMTVTVITNTCMDQSVHRRALCFLLVQRFCHACHPSLVTHHSRAGGRDRYDSPKSLCIKNGPKGYLCVIFPFLVVVCVPVVLYVARKLRPCLS